MKKRILILLMCLCIVGAVVLICEVAWIHNDRENHQDDIELLRDQLKQYQTAADTEEIIPKETENESPETITPETEPVKIPEASLDFQAMWETNPDICHGLRLKEQRLTILFCRVRLMTISI